LSLAPKTSRRRLEGSNEDNYTSVHLRSGWIGDLIDNVLDDDDDDNKDNKDKSKKSNSNRDTVDDVIDWVGDVIDGKDGKSIALGTIQLLPSTLRSNTNSTLSLRGNIVLDGLDAVKTIAKLIEPTHIRFKLGLNTHIVIFGKKIEASQEQINCGVQLDVLNGKSGEAVCGKSFADLRIPPIAKNATKKQMAFSGDPEELKEAEAIKDQVLGTAQIILYGFGFLNILLWLAMTMKGYSTKTNEKAAREVTVRRSATHEGEVV
jgi:hypothetical protein